MNLLTPNKNDHQNEKDTRKEEHETISSLRVVFICPEKEVKLIETVKKVSDVVVYPPGKDSSLPEKFGIYIFYESVIIHKYSGRNAVERFSVEFPQFSKRFELAFAQKDINNKMSSSSACKHLSAFEKYKYTDICRYLDHDQIGKDDVHVLVFLHSSNPIESHLFCSLSSDIFHARKPALECYFVDLDTNLFVSFLSRHVDTSCIQMVRYSPKKEHFKISIPIDSFSEEFTLDESGVSELKATLGIVDRIHQAEEESEEERRQEKERLEMARKVEEERLRLMKKEKEKKYQERQEEARVAMEQRKKEELERIEAEKAKQVEEEEKIKIPSQNNPSASVNSSLCQSDKNSSVSSLPMKDASMKESEVPIVISKPPQDILKHQTPQTVFEEKVNKSQEESVILDSDKHHDTLKDGKSVDLSTVDQLKMVREKINQLERLMQSSSIIGESSSNSFQLADLSSKLSAKMEKELSSVLSKHKTISELLRSNEERKTVESSILSRCEKLEGAIKHLEDAFEVEKKRDMEESSDFRLHSDLTTSVGDRVSILEKHVQILLMRSDPLFPISSCHRLLVDSVSRSSKVSLRFNWKTFSHLPACLDYVTGLYVKKSSSGAKFAPIPLLSSNSHIDLTFSSVYQSSIASQDCQNDCVIPCAQWDMSLSGSLSSLPTPTVSFPHIPHEADMCPFAPIPSHYSSIGCWSGASKRRGDFVTIVFPRPTAICAVLTAGRPSYDQWVRAFSLWSFDGSSMQWSPLNRAHVCDQTPCSSQASPSGINNPIPAKNSQLSPTLRTPTSLYSKSRKVSRAQSPAFCKSVKHRKSVSQRQVVRHPAIFTANSDRNSLVLNVLTEPVVVHKIRIRVEEYENWPSMRFELFGWY
ncbi:hypothetical protein ADUPG1_006448 [Aduncisulcus paluster]|uniref:Uncharacterized protein n=1 Tax=Aduncisulcus paluster TaxID=2918883 RepID=A0ABQ5KIA1_9EUKA|nr:hypothetical protein ADUPG1_006448 [Aduncisulcus paluster]